ncbi:hypothetical protein SAMN02745945_02623 [Peptoclostridium litorale DSM 5388]|uniref:Transposase n=1 Tax=Peptoclostridium litorale DSM 5388 TaxID=1121324 RepID=A0A069RCB0_PEPLI|nr:hypothetical protein [Peptoclostridium litorale]KDR94641.1 hypothetical protein CLIT_14c01020 [Peptoclostridium litorale DSM 5388]SIO30425.1 hypothetical protein SAMN02745945_02623 [Peptoclostridium litorale DSM 5388]
MARKPRIEYNGAIYHVIQRGNNREYIFEDSMHKGYLKRIGARHQVNNLF